MLNKIKYDDEGGNLPHLFDPEQLSFLLYDEFLVKYKGKIPIKDGLDEWEWQDVKKYFDEYKDVAEEFSRKNACDIVQKITGAEIVEYIDGGFIKHEDMLTLRNRFHINTDRELPESTLRENRWEIFNFDINFHKKESFN